jgi:hypothetical protein
MAMLAGTLLGTGALAACPCSHVPEQHVAVSLVREFELHHPLGGCADLQHKPRCRIDGQLHLLLMRYCCQDSCIGLAACLCECGLSREYNHVILWLERFRLPHEPL